MNKRIALLMMLSGLVTPGFVFSATEWIVPTERFSDPNFKDIVSSYDSISNTENPSADALDASGQTGYLSEAFISHRPETPNSGLPDDGVFSGVFTLAPTLDVKLAKFNTPGINNVWKATTAGESMTVPVTPGNYKELHVFASAGGAGVGAIPTFRMTANYSDGSRQSGTFEVLDWVRYSNDGRSPAEPTDTSSTESYFLRQKMWRIDGLTNNPITLDRTNRDSFNVMGFRLILEPTRTLESFTVEVVDIPSSVSFIFWGAMATTETTTDSTFYWITTNAPDDVGGGVLCDSNPVKANTKVVCTANPNSGFTVGGWSNCTGTVTPADTCTITNVSSGEAAVATFTQAPNTYLVTASAGIGGAISPTGQAVANDNSSNATFTIRPSLGYSILNATGTCGGTLDTVNKTFTTNAITADCTVVVNFQADFPTAINDTVTLNEDSSTTINVLSNDDFGSDGAGTTAVAITTATSNGTATVNDQGTASSSDDTISYTPNANFNGTDSFEYQIEDSTGEVARAVVSITVSAVNDSPTGAPTITGTATEGETLGVDTSSIADADGLGAFSYQWLRDGAAISGATGSTLLLSDVDVSSNISVRVSYTDQQGTDEQLTSAAVGPVNTGTIKQHLVTQGGGGPTDVGLLGLLLLGLLARLRRSLLLIAAFIGFVMLSPGTAWSDPLPDNDLSSFHLFGSVAWAHTNIDEAKLEDRFAQQGVIATIRKTDVNRLEWSAGFGYRLTEWVALEAAYLDLKMIKVTKA